MGEVRLEIDGPVAIITIDSPEVRNALTPSMGDDVVAICDRIDADLSIGAAVVRGAGGTFTSGADTREWGDSWDPADPATFAEASRVYSAFQRVGELRCATVAAVRGYAIGAGANLMMACDLRIVADTATIKAGFSSFGLHPGGGFFSVMGRTAGREATSAIGIFDEKVSGVRAVEIGIAWQALPDHEVEPRARELAASAGADPELTRQIVRSFRAEMGPPALPWPVALEFERGIQMWSQKRFQNARKRRDET